MKRYVFVSLFLLSGLSLFAESAINSGVPEGIGTSSGSDELTLDEGAVAKRKAEFKAEFRNFLKSEETPEYLKNQRLEYLSSRGEVPTAPVSFETADLVEFLQVANVDEEEAAPYIAILRQSAESGDAEAIRGMGELMAFGLVPYEREQEQFDLFLAAAELGDSVAARHVGFYYEKGIGVERNIEAAVEWYRRAIKLGHIDASVDLGFMTSSLTPEAKRIRNAHRLYRSAIEKGSQRGMIYLAMDFLSGWEGQQADVDEAIRLLNQAASARNGDAHWILANIYRVKNYGVKDRVLSYMHYRLAVVFNNREARFDRGRFKLKSKKNHLYEEGWEELADLTLEKDTGAAKILAEELLKTESRDRIEDAVYLLESAALDGNIASIWRLIELGFQTSVPTYIRPDSEYWFAQLETHDSIGFHLIGRYRASGLSFPQSYDIVAAMADDERYVDLQRFATEQGSASLEEKPRAVSVRPRLLEMVKPEYPLRMKLQEIEGEAFVLFVVEEIGTVTDVKIRFSTHPEFSQAAIDAVSKWKFAPARDNEGNTIRMNMGLKVPFSLER